jgi:SAM-dependent methyltransferase
MAISIFQNITARSVGQKMKDWFNGITLSVFRSTAQRFLDSKMCGFKHPEVFQDEDMAEHFAHQYLPEIASQNVVKGFIISRIEFIESVIGKDQISKDTFIDIGDPDGIFIKSLGKKDMSANISEIGVKNIYKKGIASIQCDAEHLPLKTRSIDHILFFEIFEHLPNPVSALQELNRVSVKSVILSIPYVSKTNIHRYNYEPSWPIFEHHIFEFDTNDFKNIISHAGLDIHQHEVVTVLAPVTIKERFVFLLWSILGFIMGDQEYGKISQDLFAGCFRKFSVYHLVKKPVYHD